MNNLTKLLLNKGLISNSQLEIALDRQNRLGGLIGLILTELEFITKKVLIQNLEVLEKNGEIKPADKSNLLLCELLLSNQEISKKQLNLAISYKETHHVQLGYALIKIEVLNKETLIKYLSILSKTQNDKLDILMQEVDEMLEEENEKS